MTLPRSEPLADPWGYRTVPAWRRLLCWVRGHDWWGVVAGERILLVCGCCGKTETL